MATLALIMGGAKLVSQLIGKKTKSALDHEAIKRLEKSVEALQPEVKVHSTKIFHFEQVIQKHDTRINRLENRR